MGNEVNQLTNERSEPIYQIMKPKDLKELKAAKLLLENPGLAAKLTNLVGSPIEKGINYLPKNWNSKIGDVTKTALLKATDAAILTMKDRPGIKASNKWHKLGVAVTGGMSGFFGLPALAIELPISTTIMLRSIAEIARSQGESISEIETKLACLEVFSLGGRSTLDDGSESGYFVTRTMLSRSVSQATDYITKKGIADSAPMIAKFISKIAERFSIQITEKAAAQSIPLIGAAGGAVINTLFIDHFQDMAKGHFIVRKLERVYGQELIEKTYEEIG